MSLALTDYESVPFPRPPELSPVPDLVTDQQPDYQAVFPLDTNLFADEFEQLEVAYDLKTVDSFERVAWLTRQGRENPLRSIILNRQNEAKELRNQLKGVEQARPYGLLHAHPYTYAAYYFRRGNARINLRQALSRIEEVHAALLRDAAGPGEYGQLVVEQFRPRPEHPVRKDLALAVQGVMRRLQSRSKRA